MYPSLGSRVNCVNCVVADTPKPGSLSTPLHTHPCYVQALEEILATVRKDALPSLYSTCGWDKVLLCPPVDNPMNLIDYALHLRYAKVGEGSGKGGVCSVS